jgi:hypothetical protein
VLADAAGAPASSAAAKAAVTVAVAAARQPRRRRADLAPEPVRAPAERHSHIRIASLVPFQGAT